MNERAKHIKILIAKTGLDGHDRGAKVLMLALRDAGMEVIYTGIRQTPESIAQTAVQEDVDVVGLSCLSGAHETLFPRVAKLLRENSMEHVLVIGGGVIPEEDIPALNEAGIKAVFRSGTKTKDIVNFINENVRY